MSSPYLLSSLNNSLAIVDLLGQGKDLTLTEICEALHIGKSSAFRMLYTLEQNSFVVRKPNNRYGLGLIFVRYARTVLNGMDYFAIIQPFMDDLGDRFNETVHLGMLTDHLEVVVLDKRESHRKVMMISRVGGTLSANATGMGKVIMAFNLDSTMTDKIRAKDFVKLTEHTIADADELLLELKRVRSQGYATDMEEFEFGIVCIAAPILDYQGRAIYALSFSGPKDRMLEHFDEYRDIITGKAKEISLALGYQEY